MKIVRIFFCVIFTLLAIAFMMVHGFGAAIDNMLLRTVGLLGSVVSASAVSWNFVLSPHFFVADEQ